MAGVGALGAKEADVRAMAMDLKGKGVRRQTPGSGLQTLRIKD